MNIIQDKIVVISGASSGIGLAAAKAFALHKARLVLLSRNEDKLKVVAKELDAAYYAVDLSHFESVKSVTEKIKKEQGIPYVLFNNAGIGNFIDTEKIAWGEMEKIMAVPYFAAFNLTKGFLTEMKEKNEGHIINVTSIGAFNAFPNATAYSAARWAMRGFSDALSQDLYATNLKVSLLVPPVVNTEYFIHNSVSKESIPKIVSLFPSLFCIEPSVVGEKVVKVVRCGKKGTIIFPLPFKLIQALTPSFILSAINRWR